MLFILGWIVPKSHLDEKQKECDQLKIAYDLERQRADAYQQTSMTNVEVLKALQNVAYDRRSSWDSQQGGPAPPPPYSPPSPTGGEGANPH